MPITIEAPNGTTKMYIVRFRLPGKNYSNQVDEASSLPVGDGVYEEVKVVPGSPFVLPEGAELIEVKDAGTGKAIPRSDYSPNGGE